MKYQSRVFEKLSELKSATKVLVFYKTVFVEEFYKSDNSNSETYY